MVRRPRSLLPYFILSGSVSLGYGSIYTLLADLRDRYGFSEAQLGLIVAAGFLAGFVAELALARLADRGQAPRLIRGGVVLAMLAMVGSAVATQFWAFLLARLLLGLGSGSVGPAVRRIVITRDPDGVGANLGRLAAFDVAGFMLGPLVAAVFAEALGIRAPFIFLAGVFVGVLVLAVRLDLTVGVGGEQRRALRGLLRKPAMQATLAASVAFFMTVGMFEAIWAVLLRDHGAETWLIGLTLSLFTMPMIFFAPIGGRQAQARGPLRVVSVSLTVATICTFSYGVLPSLWMLLAVSIVHAVADSFTMPANQVVAALASPPEHLASAQGLLGATGLAAAGLTGLAAGFVYEEVGRVAVCAGTAAIMAGFLLIAITLGRRDTRRHCGDARRDPQRQPSRSALTGTRYDGAAVVPGFPPKSAPPNGGSMPNPIGSLLPGDEQFIHQIVDTFATVGSTDLSWTEKVCAMAAARDGSLQLGFGLGKYTNRNVMDCYAGVSRGVEQLTVRASRQLAPEPEMTVIGPIRYEVLEPLRTVRFVLESNSCQPIAFDWTFESIVPPYVEDRTHMRDGYRVSAELVRYHQTGVARRMGRSRRRAHRDHARDLGVDARPLVGGSLRRRCAARRSRARTVARHRARLLVRVPVEPDPDGATRRQRATRSGSNGRGSGRPGSSRNRPTAAVEHPDGAVEHIVGIAPDTDVRPHESSAPRRSNHLHHG